MSDLVNLPPELLSLIVNELAATPYSEADLSALSLTCQYFLPLCREHIFSTIRLHNDIPVSKLLPLIEANPLLQRYVQSVDFILKSHSGYELFPDRRAASLLKHFTRVQDLRLSSMRASERHKSIHLLDLEPPLSRALIGLITSPRLKRLNLHYWHIPYQLFSFCAVTLEDLKLQRLVLYDASTEDLGKITDLGVQRSSAQGPLTSFKCGYGTSDIQNLGITTSNSSPIFDFSNLQALSVIFDHRAESADAVKNARFLLRASDKLKSLHIEVFEWPVGVSGLSTMVNPSIYSTLTKISLSNTIEEVHDPYSHICDELGAFTNLRELDFEIAVQTDCECRTGEEWGKLDAALFGKYSTGSGCLRLGIDITIWVYSNSGEELRERLERVPERHLTRIRQHKNIDFAFSVQVGLV